jgi:PPOX class probable F420-dependent enzyme
MLTTARVGRLATVDAAGRPLVVPVCFAVVGGHLYWAVDAKPKQTRRLRRLRNIGENPRVSLVVDEWSEDWGRLRWVIVEGDAAEVTDAAERAAALDALVAKYPQYAAMHLKTVAHAVVGIAPSRVIAWRAANGVESGP